MSKPSKQSPNHLFHAGMDQVIPKAEELGVKLPDKEEDRTEID